MLLTDDRLASVVAFARGLSPVAARTELVKNKHRADDLDELGRHLKILVKDAAKKLQTTNERHYVEWAGGSDVAGIPSKYSHT